MVVVSGGGLALRLKRGVVGGRVLKIPVWVVFNDYDVIFAAYCVDIFASLYAQCSRGWVLADSGFGVSGSTAIRKCANHSYVTV